jgi:hypothetical protein
MHAEARRRPFLFFEYNHIFLNQKRLHTYVAHTQNHRETTRRRLGVSNSMPCSLITHMNCLLSHQKMSRELEQSVTGNAKPIHVRGVELQYGKKKNGNKMVSSAGIRTHKLCVARTYQYPSEPAPTHIDFSFCRPVYLAV